MTGVILAGGQNTRYPEKKAFIEIKGQTILSRTLKIFQAVFDQILISTNEPSDFFFTGLPLIGDVYNVHGPMTGILSCLLNAEGEQIFVTACDMPFINENLIRYITSIPNDYDSQGDTQDAIVPLLQSIPQPLFALYHKRLIPILHRCIKDGTLSLKEMLRQINCTYIKEELIRSIDIEEKNFININTPTDFKNVIIKYYNK